MTCKQNRSRCSDLTSDSQVLTSSAACCIASAILGSKPYSVLTLAAAFLMMPKALMRGGGKRSVEPPISKFWRDLPINHLSRLHLTSSPIPRLTSESEHPNSDRQELQGHQRCHVLHDTFANSSECFNFWGMPKDIPAHHAGCS